MAGKRAADSRPAPSVVAAGQVCRWRPWRGRASALGGGRVRQGGDLAGLGQLCRVADAPGLSVVLARGRRSVRNRTIVPRMYARQLEFLIQVVDRLEPSASGVHCGQRLWRMGEATGSGRGRQRPARCGGLKL